MSEGYHLLTAVKYHQVDSHLSKASGNTNLTQGRVHIWRTTNPFDFAVAFKGLG